MQPERDERHLKILQQAKHISEICHSGEFQALRKELEIIYLDAGIKQAVLRAFQDALYTMIIQEEMVHLPPGAQNI